MTIASPSETSICAVLTTKMSPSTSCAPKERESTESPRTIGLLFSDKVARAVEGAMQLADEARPNKESGLRTDSLEIALGSGLLKTGCSWAASYLVQFVLSCWKGSQESGLRSHRKTRCVALRDYVASLAAAAHHINVHACVVHRVAMIYLRCTVIFYLISSTHVTVLRDSLRTRTSQRSCSNFLSNFVCASLHAT